MKLRCALIFIFFSVNVLAGSSILGRISELISSLKGRNKPKVACLLIEATTGKSFDDILSHYQELILDITSLVQSIDGTPSGVMGAGYQGIVTYFKTDLILPDLELAFSDLERSNGKMSWDEWSSHFSSDKAALMAVIGSLGLARAWINDGNVKKISEIYKNTDRCKNEKIPGSLVYTPCGFPDSIWGLDFRKKPNSYAFGRGYKTISGMNMAAALFEKGYSDQDILFAISRATAVYETSDLLYDHLKLPNQNEINVYPDYATDNKRQGQYLEFLGKIRAHLSGNSYDKRILFGALINAIDLASWVPVTETLFDFKSDYNLTLALILYRYEHPKEFDYKFGRYIGESKIVTDLLDAGINDVFTTMEGAKFALNVLKKSKPNSPKKGNGPLNDLHWLCQKVREVKEAPSHLWRDNNMTNLKENIQSWLRVSSGNR